MTETRNHVVLALGVLLVATVAHAGPPSKTAVTTKLACSNSVGSATATVSLCQISSGAACLSGSVPCPYTLECGSESISGVRADTRTCDVGFIPQSFSHAITVADPPLGGCFGSASSFGSVTCETLSASPKLTVR